MKAYEGKMLWRCFLGKFVENNQFACSSLQIFNLLMPKTKGSGCGIGRRCPRGAQPRTVTPPQLGCCLR